VSPVFRHGGLRLYLLKLLDEAPRHGYEVIRLLQDRFLGVYAPSPGTIYPRLARLEEEGLVTHDEVDGRKVYRITDKGREGSTRAWTTWPSWKRSSPSPSATSPAR
jgi:DNA-binding PadR family transcriptional regulator